MRRIDGAAVLQAAEARVAGMTKGSAAMFERSQQVLPGGVSSNIRYAAPHPIFARDARGSRLYDVDGNEYVDCRLGFGPVVLGHAPEAVTAAVTRAMTTGSVYALPHEGEVALAEKIVAAVPGAEMTTFCSSGSEATLHALRLARAYTGRPHIAKFEGGYHGIADQVLVSVRYRPEAGGPVSAPVGTVESPGIPDGAVASTLVLPFNDPAAFARLAARASEVAAVIVEPVQGSAGSLPATPEFLAGLRAVTARHGIVLVFDEVITGFRLALGGAQEHFGVRADLVAFGKILGGGFPFGCVAGSRELMRLFSVPHARAAGRPPVFYGGTFNGNPTSVAAASATLDFLRDHPEIYRQLGERGDRIRREIAAAAAASGLTVAPLGAGSIFSCRFVPPPVRGVRDLAGEDGALLQALYLLLLAEGVLGHSHHSFLSAAHTEDDLARIVRGYRAAFAEIATG